MYIILAQRCEMRRFLMLILLLTLTFIVGCESTNHYETTDSTSNINTTETTPPKIDSVNSEDKVAYISQRQIWHNDNEQHYVLVFSLLDANEREIAAPADVSVSIVNKKGESIFNKQYHLTEENFQTWYYNNGAIKKYQATIYINDEELLEGNSDTGTIAFVVQNEGHFSFDTSELDIYKLPKIDITKQCCLILPQTPQVVTYMSGTCIYSSVAVTDITYSFEESYEDGKVNLHIYFDGSKVVGSPEHFAKIEYKIYDINGYIVKTGQWAMMGLSESDKFENQESIVYNLPIGEYRLELYSY